MALNEKILLNIEQQIAAGKHPPLRVDGATLVGQTVHDEYIYREDSDSDKKLATIEDFVTNNFDDTINAYTKNELFALLVHIARLLDTEDGTLSPEQQAESNEVQ